MSVIPGVYLIVSKESGTVVNLHHGQAANGTKIQGWASLQHSTCFFNQLWLIEQVVGETCYTVRNLRSNTYMDLLSNADCTEVHGWTFNGTAAQHWYIEGDNETGYVFKGRVSGTVLDLYGGNRENGTAIIGFAAHGGANQIWYLTCHSRSSGQVDALLSASRHIGMAFNHYVSDPLYISLPYDIIKEIWMNKGLGSRKCRAESYDCDGFAFSMKGAICDWVYDNIRAPVAVSFGIIYGDFPDGSHAHNWYLSRDLSSIVIFAPQTGKAQTSSVYKARFGIY